MARLRKTLTDYIVIGISPALIIALISSLMLFLVEVFYRGGFQLRISAIILLFVVAATLIARISIEEGREYAMWFALPLAIVMCMAVLRFTSLGVLVGMVIIGAIWWCADKLTWDCTVIDEQEDASGQGLLQTVGLDGESEAGASQPEAGPNPLEAMTSRDLPEVAENCWNKFLEYRRRPHAPGVWVVYFSLAALPLFGLGQRFIPPADVASRRYVFKLLCIYMACGLGLLLTTSFLNLRRYLRQRRIEMPGEMAGVWLALGAVMIVAVLALCTLLPRPHPEYSITDLHFESPADLQASRYAAPLEGVQDDQQRSASAADGQEESATQSGGHKGKERGSGSAQGDEGQDGPQDGGSGQDGNSDRQRGKKQGKSSGQQGRKSETKNGPQRGQQGNVDPQDSDSQNRDGESLEDQSRADDSEGSADRGGPSSQQREERSVSQAAGPDQQSGRGSRGASRRAAVMNAMHKLPSFGLHAMKWLYYLAFFLAAGYLVWRYREQVAAALQNFIASLREFWASLFGQREAESKAEAELAESAPSPTPFSDFTNPFLGGQAGQRSPSDLARYSFEALEAWAREHQCPRQAEETPHEFAHRLVYREPTVGREARRLADLYCCAAYSRGELSWQQVEPLENLWQAITEAPATADSL